MKISLTESELRKIILTELYHDFDKDLIEIAVELVYYTI